MKHVQCIVCDNHYHKECTDLSDDEYQMIKKKSQKFICCNKCYNRLLPLSHGKHSTLVQSEILVNSIKSYPTVNVNAADAQSQPNLPVDSFIDPNKFVPSVQNKCLRRQRWRPTPKIWNDWRGRPIIDVFC